ncbi:MAG: hypothetical protein RL529_923 [Actinomycetota bacterium]
MNALTQPIRVIFNTREKGYRAKTWVASIAVFTLMAGDAVRCGAILGRLVRLGRGFSLYWHQLDRNVSA